MGQEEVSVIRKSFEDNGNLFSNENREKDIHRSRKELIMKTNGKKRIFALLMCVMMIVSSMSVWAGVTSKVIGSVAVDRATLTLYAYTRSAKAMTTPDHSMDCYTEVFTVKGVYNSDGELIDGEADYGSGTTVAIANRTGSGNSTYAHSRHQAGSLYSTLQVNV